MSEWIYDAAAGRCRKTDGEQAMSEDIIALARRHKHIATHYEGCEADHIGCLVNKLADEIEKLRAEIDGLEAELSLMKSGFEIAYRAMGDKP